MHKRCPSIDPAGDGGTAIDGNTRSLTRDFQFGFWPITSAGLICEFAPAPWICKFFSDALSVFLGRLQWRRAFLTMFGRRKKSSDYCLDFKLAVAQLSKSGRISHASP
jgi:hypothetical protein